MRVRNMRVAIVGGVMIVLAIGFFAFMMDMRAQSNDPAAMMTTAGQVSGVITAIGVVMLLVGLIGKRP